MQKNNQSTQKFNEPDQEQINRMDYKKTSASINRMAYNKKKNPFIYGKEEGAAGSDDDREGFSFLSSLTTAASASGLTPRSQSAIRTESV